jgi:hypothetical protein
VLELALVTPLGPDAATKFLQAAAAVVAATRLFQLNLARRFYALLFYLVFLALMNVTLGLMNPVSKVYFWTYLAFDPFECGLSILAVRELFTLTFKDYPGIRSVGRWMIYAGVALSLSISLALTRFFWSGGASGRAHSHLFYFEVSKRSVMFSLALVIVALLLCLSKYPLHLGRNTLVSSAFFSVLFLSETFRLLVDSLAPQLHIDYVDWVESAFVSLSLFGWAALLAPRAETSQTQIQFVRGPQEDHLLEQLNSLNRLMTRAVRK